MEHHLRIPERFTAWVLTHRAWVLAGYCAATVLGLAATWGAPVRVSILQGLMPDEDQYRRYVQRASIFGGDSDDLLLVATREGDGLFTAPVLDSIREAARELETLPEVDRVFSIVDAPRLTIDFAASPIAEAARTSIRQQLKRGEVPDLAVDPLALPRYWPEAPAQQQDVDLAALGREMAEDPIAGRLVSRDRTAHTMLVWLADSATLANKPRSGIRTRIEEVLRRHGLGQQGIYAAGTLIVQDWMFDEIIRSLTLILPLVVLVVAVLVQCIFRRVSYVVLTLLIAAVAIVWTLGVTAVVFGEITLLVLATPALILVISTADTIHLASAYVTELRGGAAPEEAVRKVFRQVGGACVLTSLTTFIGFLSLLVVPVATLRHMALACAVGVAGALLLALTLVPMALTVLRPPPVAGPRTPLLDRWLARGVNVCRRASLGYPRTVVAVHLAIMLAAFGAAWGLRHDADLPARFPRSHPLRQSIEFFNHEAFGTSTIEVIIRTDPDDLLSPATLSRLAALDDRIRAMPEVRDTVSIVSLFRIVDRVIDLDTPNGLPETQAAATACIELAQRTHAGAVRAFLVRDAGLTRIAVQVSPTRVLQVLEIGERIQAAAEDSLPGDAGVELSGYYPIVGAAVRKAVRSYLEGFILCFACVTAAITIGIGSVRLGLLAILPNVLPLVLLGGILGLSFDVVDSDVLGIVIAGFGLAVDDTIHFLHRYGVEAARAPNRAAALERTFDYTGAAIVRTTFILCVGLLPFLLSDYLTLWMLGTYLVFVLASAVLGDLLLLPALVLLFGKENAARDAESTT